MENCYYDSGLGRNTCDDPVEFETAATSDLVSGWFVNVSALVLLIGLTATLVLIIIRYWNGSHKTIDTISSKPIKPMLLGSAVTTGVAYFLILIAGQGFFSPLSIADTLSVSAALTFIFIWLLAFLLALIAYIILAARYAMRVATRTGRSRIGFIWISVLFPGLALVICLILDKDESRYTSDGQDTYRPQN
jgi:hypothetical protein